MRFFNPKVILKNNSFILLVFALFVNVKFTGILLNINMTALLSFTFFVAIIGVCFSNNKLIFLKNNYILLLILFLSLTIFSLSWTNAFNYGSSKSLILITILFVFSFFRKEFIDKNYLFYKYFSFIFFLVLIYIFYFQSNNITRILLEGNSYRYRIVEGLNSNVISVFFAYSALCYIIIFIKNKVKSIKLFSLLVIIICLVFLFITGSRGCQIAFFGSLIIFYFIYFIKRKSFIFIYIIFLFLFLFLLGSDIVLFLFELMPDSLSVFFEKRYMSSFSLESINARSSFFNLAWEGYISSGNIFHLLFGKGIGSYGYLINGFDGMGYPHNIFLEILYELGLISLIIFLAIIFKIISYSLSINARTNNKNFNWSILFFYFLFINSLSTGDFAANYLLFIYIMILLININNEEKFQKRKLNAQ